MGNSEAEPKIQGMNFITSKKVTSNDIWSKEPGLLSQPRRSLRTEFFGAKARQWTFRITHDNCQAMDSDAEPWGPKLGLCSHAALYLKLVAFLSFPIQFISSFGCPGSWSIHLKGLPASSLDHLLSHFKIAAQVILLNDIEHVTSLIKISQWFPISLSGKKLLSLQKLIKSYTRNNPCPL